MNFVNHHQKPPITITSLTTSKTHRAPFSLPNPDTRIQKPAYSQIHELHSDPVRLWKKQWLDGLSTAVVREITKPGGTQSI